MTSVLNRILGPSLLLFLGLPFAAFAVFTTSLAIATLFARFLIVYADLGLALLSAAIHPSPPSKGPSAESLISNSPPHEAARARRRRGAATPTTPTKHHVVRKTPSFASLVGSGKDRDFEGVGGWRIQRDDDEDAIWIGMNRNLELPASPAAARSHRRSFTGGSLRGSPEVGRSPVLVRSRTPGTASPEGYFSMQFAGAEMQVPVISRSSGTTSSSATSLASKSGVQGVSVKTTDWGV